MQNSMTLYSIVADSKALGECRATIQHASLQSNITYFSISLTPYMDKSLPSGTSRLQ